VISYKLVGGKNVLKEYEDQLGKTGEKEWMIRGGHRLWAAPEDTTRTYFPDNGPVAFTKSAQEGAVLLPAPETEFGLQKEIELRLEPKGSKLTAIHRITNVGKADTDLAVWALTVMAPGGVEIIPMPTSKPHPGSPKNAKSAEDFAADRLMAFWPYFDFQDPRWHFGSKYITLRQSTEKGPTKIGMAHRVGWMGYLNGGTLFVKRFKREEGQHYPDRGCNLETFTNEDMLEMESLAPLVRLAPGKSAEHTEQWELFGDIGEVKTEADIDRLVLPKVSPR
jgi:hypothetical protein